MERGLEVPSDGSCQSRKVWSGMILNKGRTLCEADLVWYLSSNSPTPKFRVVLGSELKIEEKMTFEHFISLYPISWKESVEKGLHHRHFYCRLNEIDCNGNSLAKLAKYLFKKRLVAIGSANQSNCKIFYLPKCEVSTQMGLPPLKGSTSPLYMIVIKDPCRHIVTVPLEVLCTTHMTLVERKQTRVGVCWDYPFSPEEQAAILDCHTSSIVPSFENHETLKFSGHSCSSGDEEELALVQKLTKRRQRKGRKRQIGIRRSTPSNVPRSQSPLLVQLKRTDTLNTASFSTLKEVQSPSHVVEEGSAREGESIQLDTMSGNDSKTNEMALIVRVPRSKVDTSGSSESQSDASPSKNQTGSQEQPNLSERDLAFCNKKSSLASEKQGDLNGCISVTASEYLAVPEDPASCDLHDKVVDMTTLLSVPKGSVEASSVPGTSSPVPCELIQEESQAIVAEEILDLPQSDYSRPTIEVETQTDPFSPVRSNLSNVATNLQEEELVVPNSVNEEIVYDVTVDAKEEADYEHLSRPHEEGMESHSSHATPTSPLIDETTGERLNQLSPRGPSETVRDQTAKPPRSDLSLGLTKDERDGTSDSDRVHVKSEDNVDQPSESTKKKVSLSEYKERRSKHLEPVRPPLGVTTGRLSTGAKNAHSSSTKRDKENGIENSDASELPDNFAELIEVSDSIITSIEENMKKGGILSIDTSTLPKDSADATVKEVVLPKISAEASSAKMCSPSHTIQSSPTKLQPSSDNSNTLNRSYSSANVNDSGASPVHDPRKLSTQRMERNGPPALPPPLPSYPPPNPIPPPPQPPPRLPLLSPPITPNCMPPCPSHPSQGLLGSFPFNLGPPPMGPCPPWDGPPPAPSFHSPVNIPQPALFYQEPSMHFPAAHYPIHRPHHPIPFEASVPFDNVVDEFREPHCYNIRKDGSTSEDHRRFHVMADTNNSSVNYNREEHEVSTESEEAEYKEKILFTSPPSLRGGLSPECKQVEDSHSQQRESMPQDSAVTNDDQLDTEVDTRYQSLHSSKWKRVNYAPTERNNVCSSDRPLVMPSFKLKHRTLPPADRRDVAIQVDRISLEKIVKSINSKSVGAQCTLVSSKIQTVPVTLSEDCLSQLSLDGILRTYLNRLTDCVSSKPVTQQALCKAAIAELGEIVRMKVDNILAISQWNGASSEKDSKDHAVIKEGCQTPAKEIEPSVADQAVDSTDIFNFSKDSEMESLYNVASKEVFLPGRRNCSTPLLDEEKSVDSFEAELDLELQEAQSERLEQEKIQASVDITQEVNSPEVLCATIQQAEKNSKDISGTQSYDRITSSHFDASNATSEGTRESSKILKDRFYPLDVVTIKREPLFTTIQEEQESDCVSPVDNGVTGLDTHVTEPDIQPPKPVKEEIRFDTPDSPNSTVLSSTSSSTVLISTPTQSKGVHPEENLTKFPSQPTQYDSVSDDDSPFKISDEIPQSGSLLIKRKTKNHSLGNMLHANWIQKDEPVSFNKIEEPSFQPSKKKRKKKKKKTLTEISSKVGGVHVAPSDEEIDRKVIRKDDNKVKGLSRDAVDTSPTKTKNPSWKYGGILHLVNGESNSPSHSSGVEMKTDDKEISIKNGKEELPNKVTVDSPSKHDTGRDMPKTSCKLPESKHKSDQSSCTKSLSPSSKNRTSTTRSSDRRSRQHSSRCRSISPKRRKTNRSYYRNRSISPKHRRGQKGSSDSQRSRSPRRRCSVSPSLSRSSCSSYGHSSKSPSKSWYKDKSQRKRRKSSDSCGLERDKEWLGLFSSNGTDSDGIFSESSCQESANSFYSRIINQWQQGHSSTQKTT